MTKPYLVLVNGRLYDSKLTQAGASKLAMALKLKGHQASVAYEIDSEKGLQPTNNVFAFLNSGSSR